MSVILFSFLTFFILTALSDGNAFPSLFVAVFVFLFYYVFGNLFQFELWEKLEKADRHGFFPKKLWGILIASAITLGITNLITGLIFSYSVDYCNKNSYLFSEKRCDLQEAEDRIYEKYEGGYYEDDSW